MELAAGDAVAAEQRTGILPRAMGSSVGVADPGVAGKWLAMIARDAPDKSVHRSGFGDLQDGRRLGVADSVGNDDASARWS